MTPNQDTIPGKDQELTGIQQKRFQGHNDEQTVSVTDSPGWPVTPLFALPDGNFGSPSDPESGALMHANRSDKFVTRILGIRDGTNERYEKKWIRWEVSWDLNFTIIVQPNGTVTAQYEKVPGTWRIKKLDEGDGMSPGPVATTEFLHDTQWIADPN